MSDLCSLEVGHPWLVSTGLMCQKHRPQSGTNTTRSWRLPGYLWYVFFCTSILQEESLFISSSSSDSDITFRTNETTYRSSVDILEKYLRYPSPSGGAKRAPKSEPREPGRFGSSRLSHTLGGSTGWRSSSLASFVVCFEKSCENKSAMFTYELICDGIN